MSLPLVGELQKQSEEWSSNKVYVLFYLFLVVVFLVLFFSLILFILAILFVTLILALDCVIIIITNYIQNFDLGFFE